MPVFEPMRKRRFLFSMSSSASECMKAHRPECCKLRNRHIADCSALSLLCMSKDSQGQGEALRSLLSVCTAEVQDSLLVLYKQLNRWYVYESQVHYFRNRCSNSQSVLNILTALHTSQPESTYIACIFSVHTCHTRYSSLVCSLLS